MLNKETITQSSGNNSTNITTGNVTLQQNFYSGLSKEEVKEIIDSRLSEFLQELSSIARKVAEQRAEKLTNELLQRIEKRYYEKFQQPAVQLSLSQAQIEYAKTDDSDLQEQILSALIERVKSEDRTLRQIVFDQAISTVSRIPKSYMDVLSLLLLLDSSLSCTSQTREDAIKEFAYLIARFVLPTTDIISMQSHLISCGCATGSQTLFQREFLWGYWLNNHFKNVFSPLTGNSDLRAIESYFSEHSPVAEDLFKFFAIPAMQNIYLTPVGKVIASQNFTKKTGIQVKLEILSQ